MAWLAGAAIVLAGACGGPASPRPTDPHLILDQAVRATAALPGLRIHIEVTATGGAAGGPVLQSRIGADADVNLATREFAGRLTMDTGGPQGGLAGTQSIDLIVTRTMMFSRTSANGRWSASGGGLPAGGPTNEQAAVMLANLLSNPAVTYELRDPASCSLGTCDRVLAHVDGPALAAAAGPLIGVPIDARSAASMPSFDVEVLVDQATSVVSEVRTQIAAAGTTAAVFIAISNAGAPVQVVAPPAALTDNGGLGGFGGGTVEGTVGGPVTPAPVPAPAAEPTP